MGLTVSIGLQAFASESAPDLVRSMLHLLVRDGYTSVVREVMGSSDQILEGASLDVLEVTLDAERGEPLERLLPAKEAARVVEELRKIYAKYSSYAAFSWEELEDLGAFDVQPLALTLDGPAVVPVGGVRFTDALSLELSGLEDAAWHAHRRGEAGLARRFFEVAMKHRLVVTSG